MPTVALFELQHAPAGLIEDILELRAYAHAKREYDRAKGDPEKLPDDDPMIDQVREVLYDLACEERSERAMTTNEPALA